MRGRTSSLLAVLALVLLPSCGSGDETESSPAPTAAATTNGSVVVPSELQATWRLDSDTIDEPVRLYLRDGSYTISRGGASGGGDLVVEGDEMVFSNSNLCDGVGRYRWSLDSDRLSLERIEEPCSGRAPVLEGATYVRGS